MNEKEIILKVVDNIITIENSPRDVCFCATNGIMISSVGCPEIYENYFLVWGYMEEMDNDPLEFESISKLKEIVEAVYEYNLQFNDNPQLVTHLCEDCGKVVNVLDLNHHALCRECSLNHPTCQCCGILTDELVDFNGKLYCSECISIDICNNCGTEDYMLPHEKNRSIYLCAKCHTLNIPIIKEFSFNYVPEFNFTDVKNRVLVFEDQKPKKLYMGMEIEVFFPEYKAVEIGIAEVQKHYQQNLIYAKHDGSISGSGTEFVTHPMTLEAYKLIDWGKLFHYTVTPNSSIGGHIHISKTAFISPLHLFKFVYFIRTNIAFCEMIGERELNVDYCQGGVGRKTIDFALKKVRTNDDRYSMVNFTISTIELRFPKSPYSASTLIKNVEFVHALYEYAKTAPLKFKWYSFIMWVIKNKKYKEFNKYIQDYLIHKRSYPINAEIFDDYDDDTYSCDYNDDDDDF